MQELFKLYPSLKSVELDGQTDFNQVAECLGTRNPRLVWDVVNRLSQAKPATDPKLDQLRKLLGH